MLDIKSQNRNITFSGRNNEIKKAQQILHKIKSDFPASSSFIADLLAQKHNIRSKHPDMFISTSNMIEQYNKTNKVGAILTSRNIFELRREQEYYLNNDYMYCSTLAWGIKKFKAMNCKENAEVAFLIAKINNYKNAHCINLFKKLSNSKFDDLGHSVLLVNQELPPYLNKINKFYLQNLDINSAFVPSRKSIVIDSLFGIVDYWENAIQNYKTIFPEISDAKSLLAGVREAIIENPKDIDKFKRLHPEFIINSSMNKFNFYT